MGRIGHYELGELLGEGGIGRVYAGFDTVLQREVAIKSLRPEFLSDGNFVARFRAEATSLARLNHPNITTVHALIAEGRNFYMVMERVRGETLDDVIKRRNGPLGVQDSLSIIAQAADGLSYAHSMGVIHRDIKPANLMVTEEGLVKIMDFGIARARGSQRLTRDGSIVGTLAYMAPEQLRGEPGDERSDLYSLAIVFYELLSGAAPFSAATDYDLMQAQIHARPPRLSSLVPGLEGRVERALLQALAKKPDQRFASVKAFKDALGASASRRDPSIDATDRTTSRRGAMTDRLSPLLERLSWIPPGLRLPLLAGTAALALGLLVLGVMALIPSEPGPSASIDTPLPSTPKTVAPYHSAGSPVRPGLIPVTTPPSPASPALAPNDSGRHSIIVPPTRTMSAPPIVLPRQQ